jgi:microsomal epoxide hydrolase
VHANGESRLAGLVLIDNSIGEDPPPVAAPPGKGPKPSREAAMAAFVRGMFATKQPEPYLDRLTRAALRTPESAAKALLAYPVPRTWWKEAVYSVTRPILYLVRPKFAGQAANLAARHPTAETLVFNGIGHAMFVDDPARFDAALDDFARRRVWR